MIVLPNNVFGHVFNQIFYFDAKKIIFKIDVI